MLYCLGNNDKNKLYMFKTDDILYFWILCILSWLTPPVQNLHMWGTDCEWTTDWHLLCSRPWERRGWRLARLKRAGKSDWGVQFDAVSVYTFCVGSNQVHLYLRGVIWVMCGVRSSRGEAGGREDGSGRLFHHNSEETWRWFRLKKWMAREWRQTGDSWVI
jgi:hypothetical protein